MESQEPINSSPEALTLLTDPKSPWQTAPSEIQTIFQPLENRALKIKSIPLPFQIKKGPSNICTHFFGVGESYYTCRDCCKNGGGNIMCFCLDCWQPGKHEGHDSEKRTSNSAFNGYCDCGWDDRILPESFCKNHGSKEDIEVEIPEEESKKFADFFKPLILISLYLDQHSHPGNPQKQLNEKLRKILMKICENSVFYIRQFMSILEQETIYKGKQTTILEALLLSKTDHQVLLFQVAGEKVSKIKLAKTLIKLLNQQNWNNIDDYSTLIRDCFTEKTILLELGEHGIFVNKFEEKYFDLAEKDPKGVGKILSKYIIHRKKHNSQKQFINLLIDYWTRRNPLFLVYLDIQSKKEILINLFETFTNPKDQLNQNQFENIKSVYRNSLISQLILNICQQNTDEIINFHSKLSEYQIKNELFEKFLISAMKTSKKIIYKNQTPKDYTIVPIILLLFKHPDQQSLLSTFWESLTKPNDGLREDFIETIDVIYHLIALIVTFEQHLKQDQKESKQEAEMALADKEKWMKSYLYQRGKIDQDQIKQMRKPKGKLYFSSASSIMKELCVYRPNGKYFEYNSHEKFPDFKIKFKVRERSERGNFRSVPNGNFSIYEKIQFQGKFIREVCDMIFMHKDFMETYPLIWWSKVDKIKEDANTTNFWKNYQLGYYYVVILVCAKILMGKSNQKLQGELDKIKNNQEIFEKINQFNGTPELLKRVFEEKKTGDIPEKKKEGLMEETKPRVKEEKQAQNDKKEKEKLKEKFEKFMMRRIQILSEKMERQEALYEEKQEQICMHCKVGSQKQGIDNEMGYVGRLQKQNNLSSIFHGKQNKSNVMFVSCFHALHLSCYLNVSKKNLEFSCPQCSMSCNIIFPCDPSDEKCIKKCSNILNAYSLVKLHQICKESYLQLIYKHLIESYGLNSMVYRVKYEIEKYQRIKVNEHLMKIAKHGFNHCEMMDNLDKIHIKFIQSLQDCNNELVKNVQLLISNMVYQQIKNSSSDYDRDLIVKIFNQTDPEDSQIFVQSLENLLGNQLFLDQSIFDNMPSDEQLGRLSFSLISLPEEITSFDLWKKEKCVKCQKQRKIVCLLTGKCFCDQENCNAAKEHIVDHGNSYILLNAGSGQVQVGINGGRKVQNIYYDSFMLPYSAKNEGFPGQIYYLHEYELQKILITILTIE